MTAAVVAATLLLLRDDRDLGHLVDRSALAPLERAVRDVVPAIDVLMRTVPWPALRRASLGVERLLSPGFVIHYALRKSIVRDEMRKAVDGGCSQVVLLGAGFDMLSASVPASARVFEVDLPATQSAKRRALGRESSRPVEYVAVDLAREDLGVALARVPSFDPAASTVFVAEGLVMYLPALRVDALLRDMAGGGARRSRAILSVLTPDAEGRTRIHTQRRAIDACMRWLDEPFVWGASREGLGALFGRHGLRVLQVTSPFEARGDRLPARARRRLPRPTGEVVVTVETSIA